MAKQPMKNSAFMRPIHISEELQAVVGKKGPMPRTDVTKHVWDYIKKHKLQDQKNKRMINPDATLAKVTGSKQLSMFELTSKVSKHLKEPAAESTGTSRR